jgi:hypothetical protein
VSSASCFVSSVFRCRVYEAATCCQVGFGVLLTHRARYAAHCSRTLHTLVHYRAPAQSRWVRIANRPSVSQGSDSERPMDWGTLSNGLRHSRSRRSIGAAGEAEQG